MGTRNVVVAASALAVWTGGTCGQVSVGPQVRVDTQNPNSGVETVIAVSKTNPSEIVAGGMDWRLWTQGPPPPNSNPAYVRFGYGISLDGAVTWVAQGVL